LTENGSGFVLSNGLVTVTIGANGQVTQVVKYGTPLMAAGDTMVMTEPDADTGGTYLMNASSATVVRELADLVELSFIDNSGPPHDMDWDLHYVMRRGVSGFYYFLVAQVGTATHPDRVTLSQLGMMHSVDPSVFVSGYNGERNGLLPTPAQLRVATSVQDATYLLTTPPMTLTGSSSVSQAVGQDYDEGPVYTMYDWATYRTEDLFHGVYGNGFGAWILSPSWEFYTGGPLKQELTVEPGLLWNLYHSGHAGSTVNAASPGDWQKLYGPNLIYFNAGTGSDVITDAQAQATAEQTQWPYCWMSHPLYPLESERSEVSGTIAEAYGRSVSGVMVALGKPGALLSQGYDYLYWTQADANGNFTIPAVRPETYLVHVYATSGTIVDDPDTGEGIGSVTVTPGANNMDRMTWSPPYHAHLLWSIGESDRRSGEFRFDPTVAPGENNTADATPRMYGPSAEAGVWSVPPANTTYTIGPSSPQTDWYFVQSMDGTWTINFDLTTVPSTGAWLTVAIAGASRDPHLDVLVNGTTEETQGFNNDETLYRSCLQGGWFQTLSTLIPAGDLAVGLNTAQLTITTKGVNAAGGIGGAGIYYDIIKMESD
jgi:rhamnogalacturonan endolyase